MGNRGGVDRVGLGAEEGGKILVGMQYMREEILKKIYQERNVKINSM